MRVAVYGGRGRLGKLIFQELLNQGLDAFVIEKEDFPQSLELQQDRFLIIDVTSDHGTSSLMQLLLSSKAGFVKNVCAAVVGSTGHSLKTQGLLTEVSSSLPVCVVSNFSLGLTLFEQMMHAVTPQGQTVAELAASFGFEMALWEAHHSAKLDAPSGTAVSLAKSLKLPAHAVSSTRVGKIVGEHTLFLARDSEEIRIQHIAHDRQLFANGAVQLASAILDTENSQMLKPGMYKKEDFLLNQSQKK
jgi:4-hydroxy-tetrahydrodipicolinate reductase